MIGRYAPVASAAVRRTCLLVGLGGLAPARRVVRRRGQPRRSTRDERPDHHAGHDHDGGRHEPDDRPTGDQRTGDQRTSDQRTSDQRTSDQRTSDQRTSDRTATDHRHRPANTATTLAEPRCTVTQVAVAGATLAAERCAPAGATGPVPAALVLNGCGGYEADAGITGLIARRLAARGVLALRLDYQGVRPAPPFTYCNWAKIVAAAPDFVRAIAGALDGLRADPTVVPAQVGAVGYSLGGLVTALAQLGGGGFADVPAAGFGAIGLLSPVVHGQLTDLARQGKVPPLALVVGANDEVVGSAGTVALAEAAKAGGVDVLLDVVPGHGHVWEGEAAQHAADELATSVAGHLLAIQPGVRD